MSGRAAIIGNSDANRPLIQGLHPRQFRHLMILQWRRELGIQRVARKFRLSLADVRKVVERVGRSRRKVYAELRKLAASGARGIGSVAENRNDQILLTRYFGLGTIRLSNSPMAGYLGSFTGGEISCGAFGEHSRGGIRCVGCSFDLGKLKGDTSFTSWCYQSFETHSQCGCVALERLVDQFAGYRLGFAFERCFSKQGGMVSRPLRSPAWIAALPGSNKRPRCFAAVFSAASNSSTALPPYMADHYTTRMR